MSTLLSNLLTGRRNDAVRECQCCMCDLANLRSLQIKRREKLEERKERFRGAVVVQDVS